MKKKLILAATVVLFAGSSVFAQGYFTFQAGARFVWDDFTNPAGNAVVSGNGVNVAFLWAPTNGFPQAAIGSIGNPTNHPSASLAGDPWGAILSGADQYSLATNIAGGALATVSVINSGVTKGGFIFNAGSSFQALGTDSGAFYQIFVIGWSSLYADPFAAAAANAAVGWSSTFLYASGSTPTVTASGAPLANFGASGGQPFGVSPVPEPTTLALAGLGAASLLIFRRRKQ